MSSVEQHLSYNTFFESIGADVPMVRDVPIYGYSGYVLNGKSVAHFDVETKSWVH